MVITKSMSIYDILTSKTSLPFLQDQVLEIHPYRRSWRSCEFSCLQSIPQGRANNVSSFYRGILILTMLQLIYYGALYVYCSSQRLGIRLDYRTCTHRLLLFRYLSFFLFYSFQLFFKLLCSFARFYNLPIKITDIISPPLSTHILTFNLNY